MQFAWPVCWAIDWESEGPATGASVQVARLREINLLARRGAIFAEASNELVADGVHSRF